MWSTSVNPLVPSVLICKGTRHRTRARQRWNHGVPGTQGVHLPGRGRIKECLRTTLHGYRDDGELGDDHGHPSRGVWSEGQAGEHLPARAADQPSDQWSARGSRPARRSRPTPTSSSSFEDGSVVRLAKGSSIKEDKNCEAFRDKSRSFKGTRCWVLIWAKVGGVR